MPTSMPRFSARRWRAWLSGLLIAAALVAAVLHFGDFKRLIALVQGIRPIWICLALLLQVTTYVAVATGWQLVLRAAGHNPPLPTLIRIAITKLFADQAIPTGGMSGNILLVDQLIALGITRSAAAAALILSIVGFYVAFIFCALATFLLLWANHDASPALALVLTVFLGLAVAIPSAALWLGGRAGGWLAVRLQRVAWLARIVETVAAAPPQLLRSWRLIGKVAACNLAIFAADAATLWISLHALGLDVAPWKAFVALVMASIVTTIGPIPMGLGSYEATCTAMLHLLGVPAEAAFAATMLLRLFILWLPLVPGIVLIRKVSRKNMIPHQRARGKN